MLKPNNYANTQASGDFTPVELGGHYMVIKQVKEAKSKTGKDMIVVCFDFDKSDKQAGYFMTAFKNVIRPDKKWPRNGTQYIVTETDNGDCSRSFKTFITCVEKSNNGFAVQWTDTAAFEAQFKNKKIGGVFGIVENEYQGKVSDRHELRWFCQLDRVKDAVIPERKALANTNVTKAAPKKDDGFMDIPDGTDDEIPF